MSYNPIPKFEGRDVDASMVKMAGKAPLDDLVDVVLGIDDRVQLLATYTVMDVNHTVEEKTGKLIRVHTLRPVMFALEPFGQTDDGVIRSLPSAGEGSGDAPPVEQESGADPSPAVDPEPVELGDEATEQELVAEAVRLIVSLQFGSREMLIRKMKIKHTVADRLVQILEDRGVLGPLTDRSIVRDVLIKAEDLDDALEVFGQVAS